MTSNYETFWDRQVFAVVGHRAKRNFPSLTYRHLKERGKTVFPIDPSVSDIDGDPTFADLDRLPIKAEAVVLEVPKEETRAWVERAAGHGVRDLWIHMGRDTPEALALARARGMNVRSGTCAVMYLRPGFSYHSLHKWAMKAIGRY